MILISVHAPQKPARPVCAHEMAGGHFFRPQLHGEIQKRLEFDFPVAQHIRVGGTSRPVFIEKQGKHAVFIFLGKIHGVIGNINAFAHVLHIPPIAFGGANAVFILLLPIFHKNANHIIALALEQQRGNRAVHAAGHSNDHPHF